MSNHRISEYRAFVIAQCKAMGEQYAPNHDDLARGVVNRAERLYGRIADDSVWESIHLSGVNQLRKAAGLKAFAA